MRKPGLGLTAWTEYNVHLRAGSKSRNKRNGMKRDYWKMFRAQTRELNRKELRDFEEHGYYDEGADDESDGE
ncbi:Uncharacterised protein [Slackia heliotrinireducens]|uniref:Uncharacterized protein n=1 Tax=Slackia heliotrinireducens (strain ATCC 29202 / DSM 20476 / NCTC 11029 / RHS 1) TaxID=471855 RepID=C7N1W5_SLAHD|nr:hypothetical protein [Slackia heliotrinireducens]ACV23406.1 hypothetical protein Shel_23970 [Slackia heliotrinireducens DSM 20476]VEH02701.1 Uncharacterised protein [Slackia heliotrinireducens]